MEERTTISCNNERLQNALVNNYLGDLGVLTEEQLGNNLYKEWRTLLNILFEQSRSIKKKDWESSIELRYASNDDIWVTIKKLFYEVVGTVNGYPLHIDDDFLMLCIGYLNQSSLERKYSTIRQSYYEKIEYNIARKIIEQRAKTKTILEDELWDMKIKRRLSSNIRKMRKKGDEKSLANKSEGKFNFYELTDETHNKLKKICEAPEKYKLYIDKNDKKFFDAYLKFCFCKIDCDTYMKEWSDFSRSLGMTPAYKGIVYMNEKLDERIRPIIYDMMFAQEKTRLYERVEGLFYQEFYNLLRDIMKEKGIGIKDINNEIWQEKSILYIYKGRTVCHTKDHELISATAILLGRNEAPIKLNVEYCKECKKFLMSYTVYKTYREKYGILLGNLCMEEAGVNGHRDILLSEYSPLSLCGYSVSQQVGFSSSERQYIISKIIELGILQKNEVIHYLEYFINMNGKKTGNEIALKKWEEDLDFALKHKISEQREYLIGEIKKY